jgi:hypothetical protein
MANTPFITGYVDSLSVRAGESVQFMVSAEGVAEAQVQLVRLIHGDMAPGGPGFVEREVAASMNGTVALHAPVHPDRQFRACRRPGRAPDAGRQFHRACLRVGDHAGQGQGQGLVTQFDAASAPRLGPRAQRERLPVVLGR